jgi:hypothetical protein
MSRYSKHSKQQKMLPLSPILGVVVVIVFVIAITTWVYESNAANASGGTSGNSPVGYGSLNHPKGWCGKEGQTPCSVADPGWVSVASNATSDIASVITHSSDFVSMQSRFGYTSIDIPTLVHAYAAHTGKNYYDDDHWVVSVRNASGLRCGLFDFVYDRMSKQMRFSSFGVITPQDPHAQQAFPYVTVTQAQGILQSQRKLGVLAGKQPELIFFPISANFPDRSSPIHLWSGGGNSAMNPMWYVVGSDGQDYFVGTDLNVHNQKDLPITANP